MTETEVAEAKADKAEWRILYDALLTDVEPGDIIKYEQFSEALGRDFLADRNPVYRATLELGRTRKRWLKVVPRVGYRVIEAREHIGESAERKARATRQLSKAIQIGNATDVERLTRDELTMWDTQQRYNAFVFQVIGQHENRLSRIEEALRTAGIL